MPARCLAAHPQARLAGACGGAGPAAVPVGQRGLAGPGQTPTAGRLPLGGCRCCPGRRESSDRQSGGQRQGRAGWRWFQSRGARHPPRCQSAPRLRPSLGQWRPGPRCGWRIPPGCGCQPECCAWGRRRSGGGWPPGCAGRCKRRPSAGSSGAPAPGRGFGVAAGG